MLDGNKRTFEMLNRNAVCCTGDFPHCGDLEMNDRPVHAWARTAWKASQSDFSISRSAYTCSPAMRVAVWSVRRRSDDSIR